MAGYVAAMQDKGKLLVDVSYQELDPDYRITVEAMGIEYITRRLHLRKSDPIRNGNEKTLPK